MYTLCHLKAKTKSPSVYSQAAFIDVMKMYMLALKKKEKRCQPSLEIIINILQEIKPAGKKTL